MIDSMPDIIRNKVTKVSSKQNKQGILLHFTRQQRIMSKTPATIVPIVIKLSGKKVASRYTPSPINIKPNRPVAKQKALRESLKHILFTSFNSKINSVHPVQ